MASPLLAGIPISSRFAEKLGIAQEKQDQQQMTHTKASTQDDKSWDTTLYEKSDIYRSIKDAYTAPMRAWKGEIDHYSNEGVMEAINLAGVGLTGSIPGGAKGPGSLGIIRNMSPDDFLKLAMPFEKQGGRAINRETVEYFRKNPELIQDLLLTIKKNSKGLPQVGLHDGRHRAIAAKELGIKEIPVKLELGQRLKREDPNFDISSIKDLISEDGLNKISSPIEDLEASVKEQVKQLDSTGWDRLPGAAGKRDSDVQPTFLQKMYKEHPDLVKSKPSELEKLEIKLRRIYKLPEEEIEDIMLPLWSTYLRNQKSDDPAEDNTQKTKMKKWTENEESPLLTAVEKLAGMIEGMNKPRTVIRDKDGRIMGVA